MSLSYTSESPALSPMPAKTKSTSTLKTLNGNLQSGTCSTVGPWKQPQLKRNPEDVLARLRDTKHSIQSLQEHEKALKAEVADMYMDGSLSHLADPDDDTKFNFTGVTVSLCKGKTTRIWEPSVQSKIDALQQQIDKLKLQAEAKRQFTEEFGPSHWRVNTSKAL